MGLLAVVNPSRRRRRRKGAKARRRGHRKMTAKQLRYFGPRRSRRARRRAAAVFANPVGNPRRRRSKRRSYRRNPAMTLGTRRPSFKANYLMGAVQDAAVGAGGAVAVDLAMTQAAKVLPPTMVSRFGADGSINFGYYGVKVALAVGLGLLGTQFLPGRMRAMAAKGVSGALAVQAYEITRAMLPADLVLGYMTPAPLARSRLAAYMATRRAIPAPGKLGAYYRTGGAVEETRVGEGAIS